MHVIFEGVLIFCNTKPQPKCNRYTVSLVDKSTQPAEINQYTE